MGKERKIRKFNYQKVAPISIRWSKERTIVDPTLTVKKKFQFIRRILPNPLAYKFSVTNSLQRI
jgi:hypothetical protein